MSFMVNKKNHFLFIKKIQFRHIWIKLSEVWKDYKGKLTLSLG